MSGQAMPTTFDGVKTSPNLMLSLDRSVEHARDLRHAQVTIEHLLLALTDDPDATGSLEACGVDIARLKTDIATFVSKHPGNPDTAPAVEPVPSAELRSMIDQSVEAAREAKRPDINSFIVLAAIVGQEKSEAAVILQAHGFTFNEAIEALKPRLARAVEIEAKGADGTPARTTQKSGGQGAPSALPAAVVAPTAANMEQALAQSSNSLPPLPVPSLSPRPVRPLAPQAAVALPTVPQLRTGDAQPAPRSPSPSEPPLEAPLARTPQPPVPAEPASVPGATAAPERGQPQSVDDMMASIRDKMGTPRLPPVAPPVASAPPPPAGAALPQTTRRHTDGTAVAPAAHSSAGPVKSAPTANATLRRQQPDAFDLGAPMPEDRIGTPSRPGPGRGPDLDPGPGGPPARRREPSHGAPPPAPATAPVTVAAPAPAREPQGAAPRPSMPAPSAPPPQLSPAQPKPVALAPAVAIPAAVAAGGPSRAKEMPSQRPAGLTAVNPGQLAEAIPRFMKVWTPEKVEVRIARRSLDGLIVGLEGRGTAARHDIVITSAMSVRLKAPDGGFAIDSVSPETQWVENRLGLVSSDEFASWLWTVRPLRRGRMRLHLVVSARTAGADGSMAETALPDQIIEIKVRTNYAMAAKRWAGWIAAAVIGGALGKFGEEAIPVLQTLRQASGF